MKLNELTKRSKIEEAIADCMQRKIQLTENVFRAGSDAYFETFRVAREMLAKGKLVVDDNMREMLEQTDIGEFYTMRDGTLLPLDCPMVERYEQGKSALLTFPSNTLVVDTPSDLDWYKIGEFIPKIIAGSDDEPYEIGQEDSDVMINFPDDRTKEIVKKFLDKQGITYKEINGAGHPEVHKQDPNIDEAEYQGKDVELNKPKRGGSKKYYVYVKNPKTGKVKKINFGDAGGLTAKINDPAAKRSFVARHKCKQKNDKTKAGYWACRLPRYAKSLGLKGGGAWW